MIEYDCHAHVYEHLSAVPGARYVPKAPAPLDTWTSHLQRHALRGVQTLTRMQDLSRLYVKLSAPYRTPFDTAQHIDVLHTLLEPNHLIWGSDWPHTRHESVTDYSTLASIRNRLGIASDAQAVRQLYGIE